MAELDYEALSHVISSDYRERVVNQLYNGPQLPSELVGQTGIHKAHISRTLTDLREIGVVELLVKEETQKGRLYGLTEKGEEIAQEVENRE